MFISVTFIGCTDVTSQADEIVGRWEGEIESWNGQLIRVRLEFFDNGIAIVARPYDSPRGHAFGWEQRDDVLYMDDLAGIYIIPVEMGQPYETIPPQPVSYEISGNFLTIDWDDSEFSGTYTKQPTTPLDNQDNHPLLGTWEFPREEWQNARGIWDTETWTLAPDSTGIAAEISEMEYRQEIRFRWMARGNQLYYIQSGMAWDVDFSIVGSQLHLSAEGEEIVLTKIAESHDS